MHINHEKKCFEIFDGKYYTINITNETISGQPGVGDITKQYLYQLAYQKLASINGYDFSNSFIVPKDELEEDAGNGVLIAEVELQMLSELQLKNIKVIARDCEKIYCQYLDF